ncbi:hypothetical protein KJ854_02530 [Patescibacteria group bacterium]|nr:hypothetical protein [Patescibacteria group bacterium]MBU4141364.1 hypothetical protein [Patescibacteria group bacterium]
MDPPEEKLKEIKSLRKEANEELLKIREDLAEIKEFAEEAKRSREFKNNKGAEKLVEIKIEEDKQ